MIYLDLFLGFLKVGLFSFGGAYGAIPVIREVVMQNGWVSEEKFAYLLAISESTPGPIMVNTATYIGNEVGKEAFGILGGLLGSALATFTVCMPAFVIILVLSMILKESICTCSLRRYQALYYRYYHGNRTSYDYGKLYRKWIKDP